MHGRRFFTLLAPMMGSLVVASPGTLRIAWGLAEYSAPWELLWP